MNTFVMRKIPLSLLICLFSTSFVLAAGTTSIIIEDTSIQSGSTLAMPITVEDANEIAGGSLKLSFNPEIISVQSVANGDFGAPIYNIESGSVTISVAGANAAGKANATIAIVTLKGEKEGSTALNIDDAYLNKEDGSLVTPSTRNGTVTVGSGVIQTPFATQTPTATAGKVEPTASTLKNQPAGEIPNNSGKDNVSTGAANEKAANPKLDQVLYQLATSKDPKAFAIQKGINMSGESVRVIITVADGADIPGEFHVIIEQRDKNIIQALVPVNELLDLANEPGVSYIKVPESYGSAGAIQPRTVSFPTVFSWAGTLVILYLIKHRKKNGKNDAKKDIC